MAQTSGSSWGMNPGAVNSAGRSIAGVTGDAAASCTKLMQAIEQATGAVDDPALSGAMRSFYSDWNASARKLPAAIQGVGNNLSAVAGLGVRTDQQAAGDQSAAICKAGDAQSILRRKITTE